MPKTSSWYSKREGTEVYHDNSLCTEVNNIEPFNVKEGTGGKRLCNHCERLNKQEQFPLLGLSALHGGMNNSIIAVMAKIQREKQGK